jgi:hypothetical protein
MQRQIAKLLSANDTGETGGHQAGALIPRDSKLLSFFPYLNPETLNPRCHIRFLDDDGIFWEFAFIYYNNAFFGGTRNEYRLTRMTKFIRQAGLAQGDELLLAQDDGRYRLSYRRKKDSPALKNGVLKLGTGWRLISID